jgi:phenylpyruvate tautomerase PptA (4-oxalocrotonate tautomerase family)
MVEPLQCLEKGKTMPLVRIDVRKGKDVADRQEIGRVVYEALYKAIADGLHSAVGLRREDVLINLVEVKKENWSFGNGIAQYAV